MYQLIVDPGLAVPPVALSTTDVAGQTGLVPESSGAVEDALIVTFRVTGAEGPLQPLAVTVIVAVPEKPSVHVITPVVAFMVPAPAGETDQLKPVLFSAVVVYVAVVPELAN